MTIENVKNTDKTAELARLIRLDEEVIRATRTPETEITSLFNQVSSRAKISNGLTLTGLVTAIGSLFLFTSVLPVLAGWGLIIAGQITDKRAQAHLDLQKRANERLIVLDRTQPRLEP